MKGLWSEDTALKRNIVAVSIVVPCDVQAYKASRYGRFLPKLPPCVRIRVMIYLRNCVYTCFINEHFISTDVMCETDGDYKSFIIYYQ